ncbi:MAG: aminotransferase class I/II-fold pyridoxal phosphate-dependent enzyme [Bacteroidota bacterium]
MAIIHRNLVNLNTNIKGLRQSATLAINEKSRKLSAEGKTVYKLGFGQSPFPVPASVVKALEMYAQEKDYLPIKGLRPLREAISGYWKRILDLDYSADQIMISPGSKTLLFLIQLVSDCELWLPSPSWVSYAPQGIISGRPVRWIMTDPANNWMLSPDDLENHCRKSNASGKILVLNYPSNPIGATFSSAQLKALALVARKYGILIISDEIYGEMHHDGNHDSIARYYPEGTIISNGLSKWAGAGGWRLGMFTFPTEFGPLMEALSVAASETYSSTSAPVQYAAIKAFEEDLVITNQVNESRRILKAIALYTHKRLNEMGISAAKPEGGFYLFPDFSGIADRLSAKGIVTSQQLSDRLLEEAGVAILPSFDFGRPENELTTRLSYVDFDGAQALSAASDQYRNRPLDSAFLSKYCSKMIAAMDAIDNWLNGK